MTTKEKILITALSLFNEKGTDVVTTRLIAAEMKISHGNLCYHFSKKEEIIIELYKNLVIELNLHFRKLKENELSVLTIITSIKEVFGTQLRYKFFLMEIVKIMRQIPEINQDFKNLYKQREEQLKLLLTEMCVKKLLKKEYIEKNLFGIIKHFYLIGDFWISEAEILFEGTEQEKIDAYHNLAVSYFIPYLTAEGFKEYNAIQDTR